MDTDFQDFCSFFSYELISKLVVFKNLHLLIKIVTHLLQP